MARARNLKEEVTTDETTAAELAAIEAALGDTEVIVADDDALAAAIAADEGREEAYAEQTSEIEIDGEAAVETEAKAGKKASTPRLPKGDFAAQVKTIFGADPVILDTDEGSLDDAALDQVIAGVTQVKVQEKVTNLLQGILGEAKISVYTVIALDMLRDAYLAGDGSTVSGAQIRKAYEDKGYKSGTVAAQAGQMMALFTALSMATRPERGVLKPNPNSVLLDAYASK